jgi:hypothetical protein
VPHRVRLARSTPAPPQQVARLVRRKAGPPHRVRLARPTLAAPVYMDRLAPRKAGPPRRVRLARGAEASGVARRAVRPPHRAVRQNWRRRGRRAQVAAVATILGLLLVVTMVANYLTTQLPAQMQLNDANRGLSVENQVSRLAASLRAAAAADRVGAVVSEPVSLGSLGAPPFAGADGASIGPGAQGSELTASFVALGPVTYKGPGGWPAGGNVGTSGCSETPAGSQNPTTVSCTGGTTLTQNFTNGSHFISVTGGSNLHLNFTTNYSIIAVGATGGAGNTVIIVGNHDAIYLNATGGSGVSVTLVGSNDSLAVTGKGGATVSVFLVGNADAVSWSANGASSSFIERAWGSGDSTTTTNSNAAVYYTGFNAANPTSSVCPYANDSNTDTVSGSGGTVNYNNTGYSGSGSSGGWSETWNKVSNLTCPFYSAFTVPQKSSGAVGASFVVYLRNTYAPAADVAFDQGAVVYAQSNGRPLLLVGPAITYTGGTLALWVPEFLGTVGAEAGDGTAELSARLVSVVSLHLPSDGFSISGTISIKVTTPYAAAWESYFGAVPALAADVSPCFPATSIACAGPFGFNGPLGTVYLNVTAKALAFQVATYAVTLG